MPPPVGQKRKEKKEKKRGFLSRWARGSRKFVAERGRELEDIVTGIPAGSVAAAQAIDRALPKGPLERGNRKHNDATLLRALAREMARQTWSDVRHPTRNPTSTALTALGLLTLGGGTAVRAAAGVSAASKTGKLSKGAKAALGRQKPPTRSFAGIPKKPGQFPKRYEVNANRSPVVRAARKVTLDPLYEASRKRAVKGKRGGKYAVKRERKVRELQARYYKQSRGYDPSENVPSKIRGVERGKEVLGAPMNLVRMSMYVRPRYTLQNILGTSALLASQQGAHLPATIRRTRKFKKQIPETMKEVRATMGESGAKAISGQSAGPLSGLTQKMAHLANKPEAWMRDQAFIKAAADEGITTAQELRNLMANTTSQRFQRIAHAANEAVIDYSRLGPMERNLMATQIPIFYPMTKGFTRYAGQFPTRHPVQTTLLAQLGKEGNQYQDESLGGFEPPPWAPYMIGVGGDRTINPQNVYQFSPGMDILRQAAQGFAPGPEGEPGESQPGLNLLQNLGPLAQILYASQSGKELESGFPLRGDEGSQWERALRNFAETSLPFGDLLKAQFGYGQMGKTYEPMTLKEQLAYNTFGPSLFPRRTRMKELKRQSKAAAKRRKQRKY